ncbi:aconitate hydratase 1 [Loigolactobacillus backii]|uniref:aconitate hydratase AcnA n=1 Tax=Loigolactobacillus backii TaxID=375175 RepID=UPI000C1CBF55|nr:aconitate hydratase AcnA [Loigolactobacillus backii]PIO83405.1 aconitate hydratase 1 [Loigolactobacillus backii]
MDSTVKQKLEVANKVYYYWNIATWLGQQKQQVETFPYTIRILLEAVLRQSTKRPELKKSLPSFINWDHAHEQDIPFKPERVILQDFTGIPALVDLAAMRDKLVAVGGNANQVNPDVPVDLVVDHSVQVDRSGDSAAFAFNVKREFERNHERYSFLKWAQQAFKNLTIIPPDTGIIHQINLEYLAQVVATKMSGEEILAYPDTLVGTDSHTTMVNGLGVLGWGVGGIEAEASMLGEVSYIPMPKVVGVRLTGQLKPGTTATDLALTLTHQLRQHDVVGKLVEFYGPALATLAVADRATIANMAPEYGATCGFFPVDEQTLAYLKLTNRSPEKIKLIKTYLTANHLFYQPNEDELRHYSETESLDLSTVSASVAGPSRPQDLVHLAELPNNFTKYAKQSGLQVSVDQQEFTLRPGALGIAAITSCTNTSNPDVLLAAGLLAKKAVELGLKVPQYVKTSLAPGSKVVSDYLASTGLQDSLDRLGFNLVGYGCTTCIGNSGKLKPELETTLEKHAYPVAAIESGNRNFEGRVHPLIKDTYLASPPLVIAYALAGRLDIDLVHEPITRTADGQAIYLSDLWPQQSEITRLKQQSLSPERFKANYAAILTQNRTWNKLPAPTGQLYAWDSHSTYIAKPPFFADLTKQRLVPMTNLRVLAKLGNTITTDHISPAGFIGQMTPAGQYLTAHGVATRDFNSYGSRRGNHQVMVRGTLANIRIQNQLTPDKVGGLTQYWPTKQTMTIYEAAQHYKEDKVGLIILAGKDYGMGSSRDWAAKGVALLGVKVVIAESFERIHRSNLAMMGVLPLQFKAGESATTLKLTGEEQFSLVFLPDRHVKVTAASPAGEKTAFEVILRFDTPIEQRYFENHGILPMVVADKMATARGEEMV